MSYYSDDWIPGDEYQDEFQKEFEYFDKKMKEHMSKNKYENNKFYIGSDSIFGRSWGHRTLNECIKHAQQVMDEQNRDEVFIVKIVKVVRRKAAPIEVIDVK